MFFPVFLLKIFNWRVMLYKVVLVSAVQQHESAIGIRIISFLNLPPGPRPTPLDVTEHWAEIPVWYGDFLLAIYLPVVVYICQCYSLNLSHKLPSPDFPGGSDGKASAFNAGDLGSIPGWGRSPGEGNGNPLQYSCLENPTDGGAW